MKDMTLPSQSKLGWDSMHKFYKNPFPLLISCRVASTVFHLLAIAMCCLRLSIRLKKGAVWWDDGVVAVAAAYDFVTISTLWAGSGCSSSPSFSIVQSQFQMKSAWRME